MVPAAKGDEESTRLSEYFQKNVTSDFLKSRASIECGSEAGCLVINRQKIRIIPLSEHVGEMHGRFFSAAGFEVEVNGVKENKLTYGVIGIGDSPDAARERAVQEWYLGIGQALFEALDGKPPSLRWEKWDVFSGALGLRGAHSRSWLDGSDAMNKKVLDSLAKALPPMSPGLHLLDLKAAFTPQGVSDGECRIDGVPSAEVLSAIKRLPWPQMDSNCIFKQAYILKGSE